MSHSLLQTHLIYSYIDFSITTRYVLRLLLAAARLAGQRAQTRQPFVGLLDARLTNMLLLQEMRGKLTEAYPVQLNRHDYMSSTIHESFHV